MRTFDWDTQFAALFDRSVGKYRAGNTDFDTFYDGDEVSFLASVGCRPREFSDFVEDFCDRGAPSPQTALLVAAVRRDYFLVEQGGEPSPRTTDPDSLPPKDAELDGIPWLPRIIAKARAKLRGELDPDIMFSCPGDYDFLEKHGIHPADFLRHVWAARGDDGAVARYVRAVSREG